METLPLIILNIIGTAIAIYISSYLREKAKNAATKEDVVDIQKKLDSINRDTSVAIETLKLELSLTAKKHDFLLAEKIRVFKEIQCEVIKFMQYCDCAMGEFRCGEFNPTLLDLPQGEVHSALKYWHDLRNTIQSNYIFISDNVHTSFASLNNKMSELSSIELAKASYNGSDEFRHTAINAYTSARKRATEFLLALYRDLQLP